MVNVFCWKATESFPAMKWYHNNHRVRPCNSFSPQCMEQLGLKLKLTKRDHHTTSQSGFQIANKSSEKREPAGRMERSARRQKITPVSRSFITQVKWWVYYHLEALNLQWLVVSIVILFSSHLKQLKGPCSLIKLVLLDLWHTQQLVSCHLQTQTGHLFIRNTSTIWKNIFWILKMNYTHVKII